jgi:ATP-dependent Clp protease ATP-binding subunit ClpC
MITQPTDLPLTTRSRVALAISRGIAASMGHDDVTPAHVALGLLREGENPAVAALYNAGLALRDVRRDVEAALPPRGSPRPSEVAIPLSSGEEQVIAQAAAEARSMANEFIGPAHLLLAILRDADTPAARAFARYGFYVDDGAAHLQVVLRGAS